MRDASLELERPSDAGGVTREPSTRAAGETDHLGPDRVPVARISGGGWMPGSGAVPIGSAAPGSPGRTRGRRWATASRDPPANKPPVLSRDPPTGLRERTPCLMYGAISSRTQPSRTVAAPVELLQPPAAVGASWSGGRCALQR